MSKSLLDFETDHLNCDGNPDAEIIVVCDTPSQGTFDAGQVMGKRAMEIFGEQAKACGLTKQDFFFVTCSPPIPEEHSNTEGRINKFVDQFRDELIGTLQLLQKGRLLLALGKTAARMVMGKPVQITKVRGQFDSVAGIPCIVMPMLSPTNVLRRPEVAETFNTDFRQVRVLKDYGWDVEAFAGAKDSGKYEWVTDLQFLLDNPPSALALDTETDGLNWMNGARPILASLAWKKDHAICVPLDIRYWPELGEAGIAKLQGQLRQLLANPKVHVVGHNLKFDIHCLHNIGVSVANWYTDSMQLLFALDENMFSKSLADGVRRYVPELASYSDAFDREIDKSKMLEVPRAKMLAYAGGDAEASYLLNKRLIDLVKEDKRQWDTFRHVQMPALRMFVNVEKQGIHIDQEELAKLEHTLGERERELYRSLITRVPAEIKKKHLDKGLSFTRDEFVRDILFGKDGFNFTPVVFTDSTKTLPKNERVPSTSSKQHLPYFNHEPFVQDLIQYQKLAKMRSTYVGKASVLDTDRVVMLKNGKLPNKVQDDLAKSSIAIQDGVVTFNGSKIRPRLRLLDVGKGKPLEYTHRLPMADGRWMVVAKNGSLFSQTLSDPSGFWKYLCNDGCIHPSFLLHRTNTGRTSSANPNAQNFPKRGPLAKEYRKIFVPTPGFVFLEADLSQAELRIAAWMANETTMLRIYREGGDIHEATAAAVLGVKVTEFRKFKNNVQEVPSRFRSGSFSGATLAEYYDYMRFLAKAVNFGFLYGMGWRKFKDYAKTDFGIELTDEEAVVMRKAFFALYPMLETWHKRMRGFANDRGYVRALHGALRRLPSIYSDDEGVKGECERQAINAPVQRFASDLGLLGMIGFVENCPLDDIRPVAFIHDSAVLEVRINRIQEAAAGIKWHMQNQPLEELFGITPPIPIVSDVSLAEISLSKSEALDVEAVVPNWTVL